MPAMLDDPTAPVIYRTSGQRPFPTPFAPLPANIVPRHVTLRDRITAATLIPFSGPSDVPPSLMAYLCEQLNAEIEKGDTYPMISPMPLESFGPYWFANFAAVMLLGDIPSPEAIVDMEKQGLEWEKYCLGTFYVKPNYPGRSSHVCNGGFIVTPVARNKGVGRQMGEAYLDWAPKLGYTYSVFNLVYETNVASCRIWDALGFKRIGRVKGCGALKSYPDHLVDAIIYGRDLGQEEDSLSEERFDKIRYYLKHSRYPHGADRAEKSRLRSAATHYKLIPATADEPEKLMLKGKEVIADPQRQYDIARAIHMSGHGGINKSTATIAERFHWVRIKETVSAVIKNCSDCNDASKVIARPGGRRVNGTQSGHGTPYAAGDDVQHFGPATPQTAPARSMQTPSQTIITPTPFNPIQFVPQPGNQSHQPTRASQDAEPRSLEPVLPAGSSRISNGTSAGARGRDVPLDPRLALSLQQREKLSQQAVVPFEQVAPGSRTVIPASSGEQLEDTHDTDDAPSVGQPEPEPMPSSTKGGAGRMDVDVDSIPARDMREASPSEQLFRESTFYQTPTRSAAKGHTIPAQGEESAASEMRLSSPPSSDQRKAGQKRKRTSRKTR